MSVPYMLSVYDLRKYTNEWEEGWIGEWERAILDRKYSLPIELLKLLYILGMDITAKNEYNEIDIELSYGLHRSLDKTTQEDYFFSGYERVDTTWKRSGYASQEAILYSKDDSLMKELKRMSGEYDVNSEFKRTPTKKEKKKKEK